MAMTRSHGTASPTIACTMQAATLAFSAFTCVLPYDLQFPPKRLVENRRHEGV